MAMRQRVHNALYSSVSASEINTLLQELATLKETDALVRVWDMRGSKTITPETWKAIEKLHNLGKGNIPEGTIIMPSDRPRLAASRRLHKIVKGKIVSARSDAAKEHLPTAMQYLRNHPELNDKQRSVQVATLKEALSIAADTARGLVTKLKQKKLLH